jgi:hypothetical protein
VKLSVRHTFPCTPDEFWDIFWDPAFDARMQQGQTTLRELLEDREEGPVRIQRYRFTPNKTYPAPMVAAIGTDKISYDVDNRFDRSTKLLNWKVRPSVMSDKITAEGTFVVKPHPEGCERVVDGKIEVRIMLIGGRIEQAIVSDVEAGYEQAAKVVREIVAERRRS